MPELKISGDFRAGTMDKIEAACEFDPSAFDRLFITPANRTTQNGALEMTGMTGPVQTSYTLGGTPLKLELRAETDGSVEVASAQVSPRAPRIELIGKSAAQVTIKVYNTRHIYVNQGIGRIDCGTELQNAGSSGDFFFKHTINIPPAGSCRELKVICLPVVGNNAAGGQLTASPPYCYIIAL